MWLLLFVPYELFLSGLLHSVPYHIGLSSRFKAHTQKTLCFLSANFYISYVYRFFNNSNLLNFLICPENRNLNPWTIWNDVGHPVVSANSKQEKQFLARPSMLLGQKEKTFVFLVFVHFSKERYLIFLRFIVNIAIKL